MEEQEWVNDTGLARKMEQGVEGMCGGERGREEEEHGRGREKKKRGGDRLCVMRKRRRRRKRGSEEGRGVKPAFLSLPESLE